MADRPDTTGLTRREVLALGGAASAALLTPRALLAADPGVPQVPRKLLGRTGKEVPILVLGGADGFDRRFDPKLVEAVKYGVNYIDAADCYANGTCETAVAAFHKKFDNRKELWITSKSDRHDPKGFERTLEQTLERLETDYVDMYYLHNLTEPDNINPDLEKLVARLKREGKILHFGFSCHGSNVAELLHLAAETEWVESVMFRYNFHKYGDKELNDAIDAAARANVGLIAMKTQGSEAKRDLWKQYAQKGKWTKHQAVLKLVWADERIDSAISHMTTLEMLRENVAAAVDRTELSRIERDELARYAAATRAYACDGCDHICNAVVDGDVRIGDTMRYVMYHDVYDQPEWARTLFGKMPEAARDLARVDFGPANAACPNGVDVVQHMNRALRVLA